MTSEVERQILLSNGLASRIVIAPVVPEVLCMDHSGHWARISHMYVSRRNDHFWLVSKHPDSISEEVTGRFCPQCATRYTADDAQSYQNRCSTCFQCPLCTSPVTVVSMQPDNFCFLCGYCSWRSDFVGVTGTDKKDLESTVIEREREQLGDAADAFGSLLKKYGEKMKTQTTTSGLGARSPRSARWTMEDLTNKLNSASLSEASGDAISPSASAEYKDEYVDSTAAEKLQGAYYQASKSAILPLRVPLRLKRTIRCRRDVHQGRMTILTQPKPGPLEGDSSQKVRGTWWVKDSSAIHEVPRIRILYVARNESNVPTHFLLDIRNPRDFEVNVALEILRFSQESPAEASRHPPFELPCIAELTAPIGAAVRQEVTIHAHEDDLLRDDAETSGSGVTLNDHNISAPSIGAAEWGVAVQHHKAHVWVPTCLSGPVNVDAAPSIYELNMLVSATNKAHEADKTTAVKFYMKLCIPA